MAGIVAQYQPRRRDVGDLRVAFLDLSGVEWTGAVFTHALDFTLRVRFKQMVEIGVEVCRDFRGRDRATIGLYESEGQDTLDQGCVVRNEDPPGRVDLAETVQSIVVHRTLYRPGRRPT